MEIESMNTQSISRMILWFLIRISMLSVCYACLSAVVIFLSHVSMG